MRVSESGCEGEEKERERKKGDTTDDLKGRKREREEIQEDRTHDLR